MTSLSTLPSNYGYVFAVLGGSFFVNGFLTIKVALARKKYGIKYPLLYAPAGHKHEEAFNCVQRGHQNMLESYAIVMLQMCVTGLVYPITASACGLIWSIGRVVYGIGYASGGPEGRHVGGAITHLGGIPLAFILMKIGFDLITK